VYVKAVMLPILPMGKVAKEIAMPVIPACRYCNFSQLNFFPKWTDAVSDKIIVFL
jgi:hypothetical protein